MIVFGGLRGFSEALRGGWGALLPRGGRCNVGHVALPHLNTQAHRVAGRRPQRHEHGPVPAGTPADDQALAYQEESYEEEYQYGEDQGYEGAVIGELGVDANKGKEFLLVC